MSDTLEFNKRILCKNTKNVVLQNILSGLWDIDPDRQTKKHGHMVQNNFNKDGAKNYIGLKFLFWVGNYYKVIDNYKSYILRTKVNSRIMLYNSLWMVYKISSWH